MVLLVWKVLWKVPLKKQISISSINILLKQNKCHLCALCLSFSLALYISLCFFLVQNKWKKQFSTFPFWSGVWYELLLNPLWKKTPPVIDYTMCQSLLIAFKLPISGMALVFQLAVSVDLQPAFWGFSISTLSAENYQSFKRYALQMIFSLFWHGVPLLSWK